MFRSQNSQATRRGARAGQVGQPTGQLVTVRLPDGRLVQGERMAGGGARRGTGPNHTLVLMTPPGDGGPRYRRRRRWFSLIPRWIR